MDACEVCKLLCSKTRLEREQALNAISSKLSSASDSQDLNIIHDFTVQTLSNDSSWETKHGCLTAVRLFVDNRCLCSDVFCDTIQTLAMTLLVDEETRVRISAGEVLGSLCKFRGPSVFANCKDRLIDLIKDNLCRRCDESTTSNKLVEKLIGSHKSDADEGVGAAKIFHDTAGWNFLETSIKALQEMLQGCGPEVLPLITKDLLKLIFDCLHHQNRFVRETGFYVCKTFLDCCCGSEGSRENVVIDSADEFAKQLASGMADNWSQVRLAASMATRAFFLCFPPDERKQFYSILLPSLCLNRYYLAEGVRLYNQETWRLVAVTDGLILVTQYISETVLYYISQTKSDNHGVREAACHAIAELASKVSTEALGPYVVSLLDTLTICFNDESWPVRDGACLACASCFAQYPHLARDKVNELLPLFFANLKDSIPSVRQGAAESIAKIVGALVLVLVSFSCGDVELTVVEQLKSGLQEVKNQPETSEKFADLEKGLTTFGVAKNVYAQDVQAHSDQTMYSCSSLAPKMHRGDDICGQSYRFRKPAAPWEITDGYILLLAELTAISRPDLHTKLAALLPLLTEAARKRNYVHHVVLLESIFKRLPMIARNLTKRFFKPYLSSFLEPLVYGAIFGEFLTHSLVLRQVWTNLCQEAPAVHAASVDCLIALANFIGPEILRGKIKEMEPSFLEEFGVLLGSVTELNKT